MLMNSTLKNAVFGLALVGSTLLAQASYAFTVSVFAFPTNAATIQSLVINPVLHCVASSPGTFSELSISQGRSAVRVSQNPTTNPGNNLYYVFTPADGIDMIGFDHNQITLNLNLSLSPADNEIGITGTLPLVNGYRGGVSIIDDQGRTQIMACQVTLD